MRADGDPWQLPASPMIMADGPILLVEASHAMRLIAPLSRSQSIVLTRFELFGRELVERVRPDAVVAPLIGARFDIVDLAEGLQDARFRGRLIALSGPLPDRTMVKREVHAACPGIAFEMICLTPATARS